MKPTFFQDIGYLGDSAEESDRIKYLKIIEADQLTEALPVYQKMTKDVNPKVRAQAVMGFARISDDQERFNYIKPFFKDEDPRVRANAIELLPKEKTSNDKVELAKQFANSKHLRERANALAKLLNWGYEEFEVNLLEMLDSDDEWTKTSGLWVIGETDLPHLISRLRESANDKRSHVREMAVRGIGIKGSEDDLRALMPFLQDPDRNVRVATRDALKSRLHLSFEIA
jgi:HEAT repeat protein